MAGTGHRIWGNERSFLGRLARDTRANTMAIMAIALIPLAGMVGGGVDISRLYIVKTRLQHACDGGALAGRKAMGGGTWSQSSYAPQTTANQFFDANIQASPYGASGLTRSYSESGGKVTGTASATVPMTLMTIFGRTSETLTVTCEAEMKLPNTDIMFVLDNTGSMASIPTGDSVAKIDSLKVAVKCFYEIVAKLDTDASCTTGTPSGGTGNQVQIRFGFVPYSTDVNVGKLLPTSYFANSWNYQSRVEYSRVYNYPSQGTPTSTGSSTTGWSSWSGWVNQAYTTAGTSSSNCQANVPPDTTPANNGSAGSAYNVVTTPGGTPSGATQTVTYKIDQSIIKYNYAYDSYSSSSHLCRWDRRSATATTTTNYTRTDVGVPDVTWHYGRISQNISGLKNGTLWNDSFQLPIGTDGTMKTINWDGCIEERQTVAQSSYSPIPSGAKDLDIDLAPSSGDSTTLWGPALPDMIYTPSGTSQSNWSYTGPNDGANEIYTTTDYGNGSNYYCPAEAHKLQAWPDATVFDDYVNSLTPTGNTYHDIGLLWGARLMSPTGIFSSENATTPQGGDIDRHMIFMTDGDPCTDPGDYQAYGVHFFDRRETSTSTAPTGGCTTTGTITAQVNARTVALCSAIKNKNITLWVITFGSVDSTTVSRLTTCASSGKYFNATNAATIQSTFASIANQISALRLTR